MTVVRVTGAMAVGLVAVVVTSVATAHPAGVHKKISVSLRQGQLELLVEVNADGGKRSRVLRQSFDTNRDGLLSKEEREVLKDRLASWANGSLKVRLSGADVQLESRGTRVDWKRDLTAGSTGFGLATLWVASLPSIETAELEISDQSPDGSPVVIEAVTEQAGEAGVLSKTVELGPGDVFRLRVRLPL